MGEAARDRVYEELARERSGRSENEPEIDDPNAGNEPAANDDLPANDPGADNDNPASETSAGSGASGESDRDSGSPRSESPILDVNAIILDPPQMTEEVNKKKYLYSYTNNVIQFI